MARRRSRKADAAPYDAVVGGLFGLIAMVTLVLASIWLLFFWQTPSDTSGALLDLVVQYYRPVLWGVLVVAAIALIVPVLAWVFRRASR
jgi:hypothetical protein